MTEHERRRRARHIIAGGQQPAQRRPDAERLKVITRDAFSTEALGAAIKERHHPDAGGADESIERGHALQIVELWNRQPDPRIDTSFSNQTATAVRNQETVTGG